MAPENVENARNDDLPEPMYCPETAPQRFFAWLYSWLTPLLFALTVTLVLFVFVGNPSRVSGSSMVPTLDDKDLLLVQHIGYTPKAGDVVVLAKASYKEGAFLVKRVIATQGQTVDLDYDTGAVRVDGVALDEPYLGETMRQPYWETSGTHFEVPPGHVFVLGDNRNNSTDSRSPYVGMVDTRCVLGKVIWKLMPFGGIGK